MVRFFKFYVCLVFEIIACLFFVVYSKIVLIIGKSIYCGLKVCCDDLL